MKKIIYSILALIFLILLVFAYLAITKKEPIKTDPPNKKDQTETPTTKDQPPKPTTNNGESRKINTPKGDVDLTNVYKNKIPGTEFSLSFAFKKTGDYSMEYFFKEKFFLIVLLNNDLDSAREKAENDFLTITGADREQACYLKVEMTVPYFVNDQASGYDYGLSFCKNSQPLPKK